MVSDNHYDDDALLRLLRNRMGDTQETALAHVETCDTCQSKLETISQSGMSWDEMSELLRPNDLFPVREHHLLPDGAGDAVPALCRIVINKNEVYTAAVAFRCAKSGPGP